MSTIPPFGDIMKNIQGVKARMDEVTQKAGAREATAAVGGGMVTATANGRQEIVRIKIEPTAISDLSMLEDLIAAACNQALAQTKGFAQEEMQKVVGGLGGMLPPGFDLSKIFSGM